MTTPSPVSNVVATYSRVMVAVDPTPASASALRQLRRLLGPGVAVRVVCVAENPRTLVPLGKWSEQLLAAARDELRRDANAAIEEARHALDGCADEIGGQLIELYTHGGDVAHALAEAASQWRADLVVLGTRHHHGLLRWIEGEVSAPLARLLHWPLLIVPADYEVRDEQAPSRILFATDGSEASLGALRAAIGFAAPVAHWRVVYVIDRLLSPRTGFFEAHFEDLLAETGHAAVAAAADILAAQQREAWAVETALVETKHSYDDVAHAIVREAQRWDAHLIVLGAHGRRGLTRWLLGSVAERTVRLTPVPLLLAPTDLVQPQAASASE